MLGWGKLLAPDLSNSHTGVEPKAGAERATGRLKWSSAKLGRPTPAFELDMGYGRHPVASGCIAAQLCQGVSSQGLAETELAPGDSREEEETA